MYSHGIHEYAEHECLADTLGNSCFIVTASRMKKCRLAGLEKHPSVEGDAAYYEGTIKES